MNIFLGILFFLLTTVSLSYAQVPQPDADGNIIINGDFTLAPGESIYAPGPIIFNAGGPILPDPTTGDNPIFFGPTANPFSEDQVTNSTPINLPIENAVIPAQPIGTIPSQIVINTDVPFVLEPGQELRADSIIINSFGDQPAFINGTITAGDQGLISAQQADVASIVNMTQLQTASEVMITESGTIQLQ